MLIEGRVKWFNTEKGYGFLRAGNIESDIMVHYKSIQGDGFKDLAENELVLFDFSSGPKGLCATIVIKQDDQGNFPLEDEYHDKENTP